VLVEEEGLWSSHTPIPGGEGSQRWSVRDSVARRWEGTVGARNEGKKEQTDTTY
jgi:hypothetical protein